MRKSKYKLYWHSFHRWTTESYAYGMANHYQHMLELERMRNNVRAWIRSNPLVLYEKA